MSEPTDDWALVDARAWLRDRVEDGATCPCCKQFAKVYYRKVNSGMVRALVALYLHARREGDTFLHTASEVRSHEVAQLSWWELIEEEATVRTDGGRAGWWRITQHGIDWLHARTPIKMYARIYDGRLLALYGEPYWVADAVREKFNLAELMRGI